MTLCPWVLIVLLGLAVWEMGMTYGHGFMGTACAAASQVRGEPVLTSELMGLRLLLACLAKYDFGSFQPSLCLLVHNPPFFWGAQARKVANPLPGVTKWCTQTVVSAY